MKVRHIAIVGLVAVAVTTVAATRAASENDIQVAGFFTRDPPPPENIVKARELMSFALDACLVSQKLQMSAGLTAAVDKAKLALNAGGQVDKEKISGAIKYLNEQIRAEQDDKIRDCLKPRMDKVEELITGVPPVSNLPQTLSMRLALIAAADPDAAQAYKQIAFGEKYLSSEFIYASPQPNGRFERTIGYPSRTKPYDSELYWKIKNGYVVNGSPSIHICLVDRNPAPISVAKNFTVWVSCASNKRECDQIDSGYDPGWVDFCPASASTPKMSPKTDGGLGWPRLVGTAHASEAAQNQEKPSFWVVPSLKTMMEREAGSDLAGTGFTEFHIKGAHRTFGDATPDGVVVDTRVNKKPVLVDGITPEYRTAKYDPEKGVDVAFALQNLDFSGKNAGCDTIETRLTFVAGGKPISDPIILQRSYVALRDAEPVNIPTADPRYSWTGKFHRPVDAYDNEVFFASIPTKNLDDPKEMEAARQQVNKYKDQVDKLGLKFKMPNQGGSSDVEMPVVAVIRPPLSNNFFGLALAIVEKSGQIRFTYTPPVAEKLLAFAMEKWKTDDRTWPIIGKPKNDASDAKRAPRIYIANKDIASPKGICTN